MSDPAGHPNGSFRLPEELSAEYCDFNRVLPLPPIAADDARVRVAASGTPQAHVLADLDKLFGKPVELVPTDDAALNDAIRRAFASAESVVELVKDLDDLARANDEDGTASTADVRDLASQPPVIRYVNLLIREAAQAGASDIHLEAAKGGLRVRFRVDGVLSDVAGPPRGLQAAVVSRLKLLAELDIGGQPVKVFLARPEDAIACKLAVGRKKDLAGLSQLAPKLKELNRLDWDYLHELSKKFDLKIQIELLEKMGFTLS